MKIFALFIHQGRHEKDIVDTLLMPVGIIALADFLTKKGFKTLIVNNSLNILKKKEKLEKLIKDLDPEFLCLSLHWHFQIKETVEIAKNLKRAYPFKKIALGGFTASYFAREIMEEIPEIDYIIRGDAEIPLFKLFSYHKNGGKLSEIPNLFCRVNGKVIEGSKKFTANRKILDSLDYSNYNLIINKKDILQGSWRCIIRKDEHIWDDDSALKPRAYYTLARGCSYNCSFCGGSRMAQIKISGRKAFIAKSYESVIRDIKGILKLGIKNLYFCGLVSNSKYFSGLFSEFRKQKISFSVTFEGCGLPSEIFLKEFSATFSEHLINSRLIFFPESGSEAVRRVNKGIFFNNIQIFKCLDMAKKLGINIEVRFILGLPNETQKTFMETLAMAKIIRDKYNYEVNIHTAPLEPGSPMHQFPEKYNIKAVNKTFRDYLNNPLSYENLGYESFFMDDKEIKRNYEIFRTLIKKNIFLKGKEFKI